MKEGSHSQPLASKLNVLRSKIAANLKYLDTYIREREERERERESSRKFMSVQKFKR